MKEFGWHHAGGSNFTMREGTVDIERDHPDALRGVAWRAWMARSAQEDSKLRTWLRRRCDAAAGGTPPISSPKATATTLLRPRTTTVSPSARQWGGPDASLVKHVKGCQGRSWECRCGHHKPSAEHWEYDCGDDRMAGVTTR